MADRWDRRNVMVACNVVAGVTLLALVGALTIGSGELVMLYVVATVLAACDVTYTLAVQASLPDVISQDRLAVANGRLIAVEGAGEQLIGPALGGVLFSLARRLPFFADSISFFVSASLVAIGLPRRARPAWRPAGHGAATSNGARPHVRATEQITTPAGTRGPEEGGLRRAEDRPRWTVDFRQGLSVFRSDRALKLLAAVAAAGALCQTMVLAILVLYGEQTLHLTSTGYGLFLAFAAAIGVAGAHFAGYLQERWGSGQLILGGLTLAAVSYIGLAFTHSVVPAVFVFGLQEIGTVAANVGSVTARQHIIPRRLYGRVGSVHRLAVLSASAVGALLGGFIASASSVEDHHARGRRIVRCDNGAIRSVVASSAGAGRPSLNAGSVKLGPQGSTGTSPMLPSKSRATQVFGSVPVHGASRDFFLSTAAGEHDTRGAICKSCGATAGHNSLS